MCIRSNPAVRKKNMTAIPRAHQFTPVPLLADDTNMPIILARNKGMMTRLTSRSAKFSGKSFGKTINNRIMPTITTVTTNAINSITLTILENFFRPSVSINFLGTLVDELTIDSTDVLFDILLVKTPCLVRSLMGAY